MDEAITDLMDVLRFCARIRGGVRESIGTKPYCPTCDIAMILITPADRGREVYVCDECASIWECLAKEGMLERRVDNDRT